MTPSRTPFRSSSGRISTEQRPGGHATMKTALPSYARPAVRKVLNFAAPALVLGLIVVSQVQARINYPPGPAGRLERAIDNILLKERADILRQARLVTQQ